MRGHGLHFRWRRSKFLLETFEIRSDAERARAASHRDSRERKSVAGVGRLAGGGKAMANRKSVGRGEGGKRAETT